MDDGSGTADDGLQVAGSVHGVLRKFHHSSKPSLEEKAPFGFPNCEYRMTLLPPPAASTSALFTKRFMSPDPPPELRRASSWIWKPFGLAVLFNLKTSVAPAKEINEADPAEA